MEKLKQLESDLIAAMTLENTFLAIHRKNFTTMYGTHPIDKKIKCPYRHLEDDHLAQNAKAYQKMLRLDHKYFSKLKLTKRVEADFVDMHKPFQDISAGKFEEYNHEHVKMNVLSSFQDVVKMIKKLITEEKEICKSSFIQS